MEQNMKKGFKFVIPKEQSMSLTNFHILEIVTCQERSFLFLSLTRRCDIQVATQS